MFRYAGTLSGPCEAAGTHDHKWHGYSTGKQVPTYMHTYMAVDF